MDTSPSTAADPTPATPCVVGIDVAKAWLDVAVRPERPRGTPSRTSRFAALAA